MNTNNKLTGYKQQRIQAVNNKSDADSFFNLPTGSEMFAKVEELLP